MGLAVMKGSGFAALASLDASPAKRFPELIQRHDLIGIHLEIGERKIHRRNAPRRDQAQIAFFCQRALDIFSCL
jgi:hypothetical protein